MNYANINEAFSFLNNNDNYSSNSSIGMNNHTNYIIDLDEYDSDENKDNNDNNNSLKINSVRLLNTYKNLNNSLNTNIKLVEDLENNKMLLFNFLSSIYNKHDESISILNNDLYNNPNMNIKIGDNDENNNNKSNECSNLIINYIEKFNELYSLWNREIYIKNKNKLEKLIEDDQIQLNGLRKIFIDTTNEIIGIDKKVNKNTCPICFDNEINMVAIPCGHVCCNLCVMKNIKFNNGKCLCCRNPLKEYIKLFIQL